MPLSEHEQRILAEIERRLSEDDPGFVERARKTTSTDHRLRRLRWSVIGFVVGFVALLGLTFNIALGFGGFALMMVSVVTGATALRGLATEGPEALVERIRSAFRRKDRKDQAS